MKHNVTYYDCDKPDCQKKAEDGDYVGLVPDGWVQVYIPGPGDSSRTLYYCSVDHAAADLAVRHRTTDPAMFALSDKVSREYEQPPEAYDG